MLSKYAHGRTNDISPPVIIPRDKPGSALDRLPRALFAGAVRPSLDTSASCH
ncbi:MAG: hypothetical protein IRZ13_17985 [Acetobacteraceae bacterium]|nr:hypothetical protein [Acetobacteraceae bacterium]